MQGRLGPPDDGRFQHFPRGRWADEFPRAAAAGLAAIEWIVDEYGADANPLTTAAGADEIRAAVARTGVEVKSVCADIFLDVPIVRTTPAGRAERFEALVGLLRRCGGLGIRYVVIPFVDASRIETPADADVVVDVVGRAVPVAAECGVEMHLETSLAPGPFADLLARLPSPWVRANYDSGNSASLGYDPRAEFTAYGDRVGSVHVKDRVRGGGTVTLGTGDTDFRAVFESLAAAKFDRTLILQAARGTPGDEVAHAAANRAFTETWLRAVGLLPAGGDS